MTPLTAGAAGDTSRADALDSRVPIDVVMLVVPSGLVIFTSTCTDWPQARSTFVGVSVMTGGRLSVPGVLVSVACRLSPVASVTVKMT